MRQARFDSPLEKVSPFLPEPKADGTLAENAVLSLLYPTPDFEGDPDKYAIVKKNLLSALDDDSRGPAGMRDKIRSVVESLDQGDLPPGGFAIFSNGDQAEYFELQESPEPRLHLGSAALALPLLADNAVAKRFWVAVLDVEAPRLLHVVDGRIHDETPEEISTLSETMQMYHPMASAIWHSSGSVRRSGAPAKFHALGTATEDLRNDEIVRVLTDFGKKVSGKVTGKDPLILAGGPARIGHFREHFSHRNLLEHDIQAAGEALEEEELLRRCFDVMDQHQSAETEKRVEGFDTSNALTDVSEMKQAAHRGRAEAVLLHPDHRGLLTGDDERVKLPEDADGDFVARSEAVSYAVKNGASLHITRQHTQNGPVVVTRYD